MNMNRFSIPGRTSSQWGLRIVLPAVTVYVSLLGIILSCLLLSSTAWDDFSVPLLGLQSIILALLIDNTNRSEKRWDWRLIAIFVFSIISTLILTILLGQEDSELSSSHFSIIAGLLLIPVSFSIAYVAINKVLIITLGNQAAISLPGITDMAQLLKDKRFRKVVIPAIALYISLLGVILGCVSLCFDNWEIFPIPLLGLLALAIVLLLDHINRIQGKWDKKLLLMLGVTAASTFILAVLPEYIEEPLQIGANASYTPGAILHRSFISAILLIGSSLPILCISIYHLLGATPGAQDISRYPLLILPVILVLVAYGLIFTEVFVRGVDDFDTQVITTPFQHESVSVVEYEEGLPQKQTERFSEPGMLNHILGTLLLVVLTSLISLPVGVGIGLFLGEYTRSGWFPGLIRVITNSLRSISLFILGIIALGLVAYTENTFFADIIAGYYYDANGERHFASGSFVLAACVLSFLVIPVIARVTEEGCNSLPQEIREGSYALGASEYYTLSRVVLPWSLPNIVTGLLIGCAEVAGSVAVIMFIAGTGNYGVKLFSEATSLSYFIFHTQGDDFWFKDMMRDYKYMATLLLMILTLGLTTGGLYLQRRFRVRYRGE